ncbi:hypothetical protein WJX72_001153 [[Myrmecia] bisecta]|uniref:C2 domain-containing protein n=1 Tax=[Myrmecia] bisecta TaxID=41462 RepID=A0AAW1QPP9_9CHLO
MADTYRLQQKAFQDYLAANGAPDLLIAEAFLTSFIDTANNLNINCAIFYPFPLGAFGGFADVPSAPEAIFGEHFGAHTTFSARLRKALMTPYIILKTIAPTNQLNSIRQELGFAQYMDPLTNWQGRLVLILVGIRQEHWDRLGITGEKSLGADVTIKPWVDQGMVLAHPAVRSPAVKFQMGQHTVSTRVSKSAGTDTIFDDVLELPCPDPGVIALTITVYNHHRLRPHSLIGTATLPLAQVMAEDGNVRVLLHDKQGVTAGELCFKVQTAGRRLTHSDQVSSTTVQASATGAAPSGGITPASPTKIPVRVAPQPAITKPMAGWSPPLGYNMPALSTAGTTKQPIPMAGYSPPGGYNTVLMPVAGYTPAAGYTTAVNTASSVKPHNLFHISHGADKDQKVAGHEASSNRGGGNMLSMLAANITGRNPYTPLGSGADELELAPIGRVAAV